MAPLFPELLSMEREPATVSSTYSVLGQCHRGFVHRAGVRIFEDCDRGREGLTHALAKHTLGGKFCIFCDVSLASGWQCVSLPAPYSSHVAPTWLS